MTAKLLTFATSAIASPRKVDAVHCFNELINAADAVTMNGPSRTDEVLALLNKRERGEGQKNASKADYEDALCFT